MHTPHHHFIIRPARELDLAQIMVLERETGTAPHWAWADYTALLRAAHEPSHEAGLRRCLFVAVDGPGAGNQEIVGFAVASAFGTPPEVVAELESVVVDQAHRRQGLGSALCRAVMDWATRQGAAMLGLEARASSTGAVRLYGGLGFVAAGRRPGYYHEPVDDAIIMHCALRRAVQPECAERDRQAVLF